MLSQIEQVNETKREEVVTIVATLCAHTMRKGKKLRSALEQKKALQSHEVRSIISIL